MKNKILKTIFTLIIGVLFIANIDARSLGIASENPVQEGEYNSVRFVAGNNATNKARIDGLSFIAGNNVIAEGTVTYGFYAGQYVTINEYVEKDAFAAGSTIIIGKDAYIGRDIFAAAEKITVESNITRDARLAADTIIFNDVTVSGDAYIDAENIIFSKDTKVTGKLKYPENANIQGLVESNMGSIEKTKYVEVTEKSDVSFVSKSISFVLSIASAIITLIVLFAIAPFIRTKLDKEKVEAGIVAKTSCIGLGVLVLVPLVVLFTIFTGILTPLALIVLVLYIICIYLSSLISGYVFGRLLLKKFLNKDNMYLSIICGIVVFKIVSIIPFIGGLLSFIFCLYGLGIIFNYVKTLKDLKPKAK